MLIYKTRSKFGWSKSGEFSLINSEFLSHMVSPRVATNHPSRTNRNKRCRRSTELEGSQLPRELGDTQDWSWKILVKMWTMILHSFRVEETCVEWNISRKVSRKAGDFHNRHLEEHLGRGSWHTWSKGNMTSIKGNHQAWLIFQNSLKALNACAPGQTHELI